MKLDYHIFKSIANGFFGMFIGRKHASDLLRHQGHLSRSSIAVTRAYPAIRQEFDRLIARMERAAAISRGRSRRTRAFPTTTPKRWNVFMLEIMGHKPAQNRACCPETCRALEQVPNMIQAFFSILDPGKSVPRARGALSRLSALPSRRARADAEPAEDHRQFAGLRLAEGEAVLFDDSWPHSVVNTSERAARGPDRGRAPAAAARRRSLQPLHGRRGRAPYLRPRGRAQGRSIRQRADRATSRLPPDPESCRLVARASWTGRSRQSGCR